ncbi:hypothetical protein FDP41_009219 [Naegleria fowleri]|uniref:Uncharacterized protein n=1 Tax=Naegleria fowleri TaxID=5763 RepID=A0A6A5BCA8_NAEFO|nr:uncharacterized protein FDP41_009219 [Naegleria fowleri]KAF0972316.1 hypothetical protein FDP41_009219 [Naegleria fowleri]CAG4709084.1 unnamed protein product [Naegleria fowleri]
MSQNTSSMNSTSSLDKQLLEKKMNFVERFYWSEDDPEIEKQIAEACKPKMEQFQQCVQQKSYNRCIIPERRDYQRCLFEEKLKLKEKDHSLLQRMVLKAEFYRGNAGDIPSDYIEQRFEEDRRRERGELTDDED